MTVILFDIDGTLVRTGGAGKAAIEAALVEDFGVTLAAEEVPYSGRTDRAISTDLLVAHGLAPTDANIARLIDQYVARLPAALTAVPGQILPGIEEILTAVARIDHIRVGLLTGNVRRGAERKLGHFGLWDGFAFGGFGDHSADRDDVARAALADARAHCGDVNPADVWVIGDTPLDVSCGRAIGANTVAVATGWHPLDELRACGANFTLPDLSDHTDLLARWR